jgi:hypothetical protein
VARSRPLEFPQRRLTDPPVSALNQTERCARARRSARRANGERDAHGSNPLRHRCRPYGDGRAGRYLRDPVRAVPRRGVERASPGRACGARTTFRGKECGRLRLRRGTGVRRARECPPVPKRTRLVPAKRRNLAIVGNTKCPFAGTFLKPSDGLEPSTPSLPWRFPGGTGVHGRTPAGTFLLQIDQ